MAPGKSFTLIPLYNNTSGCLLVMVPVKISFASALISISVLANKKPSAGEGIIAFPTLK